MTDTGRNSLELIMKVTFFSAQRYDQHFFDAINAKTFAASGFSLHYQQATLNTESAALAHDSDAVCVFVNDQLDAEVLRH